MASAELSRRVGKVVGYPPLCDRGDHQRREFHDALLDAGSFEDPPGKWQAAILAAEQTGRRSASSVATEPGLHRNHIDASTFIKGSRLTP